MQIGKDRINRRSLFGAFQNPNYFAGLCNCLVEVRGTKSSFPSPLSREPPIRRTPEAFPVASEARVCTPDMRDGSPRAWSAGPVSAPR